MLISDVTQFAREYGSLGRAVIISSDKGIPIVLGPVLTWELSFSGDNVVKTSRLRMTFMVLDTAQEKRQSLDFSLRSTIRDSGITSEELSSALHLGAKSPPIGPHRRYASPTNLILALCSRSIRHAAAAHVLLYLKLENSQFRTHRVIPRFD